MSPGLVRQNEVGEDVRDSLLATSKASSLFITELHVNLRGGDCVDTTNSKLNDELLPQRRWWPVFDFRCGSL